MSSSLNPQQLKAVKATDGPVMVIAGPGTGKTRTLVHKIAYLIKEKHFSPQNILALTFTKKAAKEIEERVKSLLGNDSCSLPFIHTFHSLSFHLLSQKIPDLKIIEEQRRIKLIKELIKELGLKQKPRQLSLLISRFKIGLSVDLKLENIVKNYDQKLNDLTLVDFDDLLIKLLKLLKNDPHLTRQLQTQYKYILVDEFQDTNQIQYQLLKLLLNSARNITVFGDPRQSIYAFRGADSRVFDLFTKDFPGSLKITLKINYRSSQDILKISQKLFPKDRKLKSKNNLNSEVKLIKTLDRYTEADWIIRFINQKIGGLDFIKAGESRGNEDDKVNFSDFAIIYRTHSLNRVLKKKFSYSGIPFQAIGDDSIFDNKKILFLASLLQFLATQDSKILTEDTDSEFLNWLKSLSIKNSKINFLLDQIIEKLKLEELEELNQLYSIITRFDSDKKPLEKFNSFWNNFLQNDYYDDHADKVTLLTMHATKGLEFKYVFICAFEDGIIPYTKKEKNANQLEEEKRLFYVALTRAKQGLFLFSAKQVSPFLSLIKCPELIQQVDQDMERIQQTRHLAKLKKSQMNLF